MSAREVFRQIIGIELDESSPYYTPKQRTLDVSHNVILYLDDITVSFDGFKALNKLTLAIDAGELRCIIGPNGAGKTTMMDVITGKTRPDSGSAFFGQTIDLTRLTEPEIAHIGIGRKFQKPTIFEQHSVFENLELAMTTDKRALTTLTAWLRDDDRDRIADTLRLIRLNDEADRPAGLLSHGQKQWLEIGMLLMQGPKLLLLDEPVAGMTDDETMRTAELFVSLAGKHSLVVVEHDMAFVKALGGKITVLKPKVALLTFQTKAIAHQGHVEAPQFIVPEQIAGPHADATLTAQVFHGILLPVQAASPVQLLSEEAIEVVLQLPVILGLRIILTLVFQLTLEQMSPRAMFNTRITLDLQLIGVVRFALDIQLEVEIALPDQVIDQLPWRHSTIDITQSQGSRSLSKQPNLPRFRGLQALCSFSRHPFTAQQQGRFGT